MGDRENEREAINIYTSVQNRLTDESLVTGQKTVHTFKRVTYRFEVNGFLSKWLIMLEMMRFH